MSTQYVVGNPGNNERPKFGVFEDAKRTALEVAEQVGESAIMAFDAEDNGRLVVHYAVQGGKVVPVEFGPN